MTMNAVDRKVVMADVILSVDAISKSFGSLMAARALTFDARPGEVIGSLGPNAAGS